MDDLTIRQLFIPLWDDVLEENQFYIRKPLLAHYTSIQTLESILKGNELWFSNPLFMNDMEEVKFGIFESVPLIRDSNEIADACKSERRFDLFKQHFNYYFDQFANGHVLDTYIFCLSEHNKVDDDGILSMWRGYGNNGNGAAIVFDTAKINVIDDSPFIISKVNYSTRDELTCWVKRTITIFSTIFKKEDISDDKIYLAAFELFERIKTYSLLTKHYGFREEDEWRIIYMVDRDINNKFESMFDYSVGIRGVEPKLKCKVEAFEGLDLKNLIDRIILGPSVSSLMAKATISRMLDKIGKSELKDKVCSSTIPFRST